VIFHWLCFPQVVQKQTNNLCFVDDIAAIIDNNEGLKTVVTNTAMESGCMGMSMNIDKTETQLIGKQSSFCNI